VQDTEYEEVKRVSKIASFSVVCCLIGPFFAVIPLFLKDFQLDLLNPIFLLFGFLISYPFAVYKGFYTAIIFAVICYYDIYKFGHVRYETLIVGIISSTIFLIISEHPKSLSGKDILLSFFICSFAAVGSIFVSRKFGILTDKKNLPHAPKSDNTTD
jgi:hypothetical protein